MAAFEDSLEVPFELLNFLFGFLAVEQIKKHDF